MYGNVKSTEVMDTKLGGCVLYAHVNMLAHINAYLHAHLCCGRGCQC